MVKKNIRKKVFGITLEPTLINIIKQIKKKNEINISKIVEDFLINYLKSKYPRLFINYDYLVKLDKKNNTKKRGRKKRNLL